MNDRSAVCENTDLLSHRSLLSQDDLVISERPPRRTDKQLEWMARKAAGDVLKPDDELLDIEVSNLRRYRDNGIDKAVTPKRWANVVPLTRGLMTITYTRQHALFLQVSAWRATSGPGFTCFTCSGLA